VTKVLNDVVESIADTFSPRPRQPRGTDDLIQEVKEMRRLSSYNRNRFIREAQNQIRQMPSERDVEVAVIEALRREQACRRVG